MGLGGGAQLIMLRFSKSENKWNAHTSLRGKGAAAKFRELQELKPQGEMQSVVEGWARRNR